MIDRSDALDALTRAQARFDVVVVGGGVTGAGVALDAASRGYSVALIERGDWACGTSSRSSKMVHGGLRYLRNFDLGLVREALLERRIMVRLAPHLVRPVPFLVPAFPGERIDRKIGLGLNAYDVMQVGRAGQRRGAIGRRRRGTEAVGEESWSPARHRVIGGDETIDLAPALASREPHSAYMFFDCQTDDARLVLTILGEAERYGVVPANRVEAIDLLERDGRAHGVLCRDVVTGSEVRIEADNVVNATGVWADRLRPAELHDEAEAPVIKPSRGVHITLSAAAVPLNAAVVLPAGGGDLPRREIFALPWMGVTLVGTTDNPYAGPLDHVRAAEDDVAYLLRAVNEFFALSLTERDLVGAFAGVRPLISSGEDRRSVDISRRAELYETSSGMLTITGGKLTTWRPMARTVVDRMVEREGRVAPCRTADLPLGLAADPAELPAADGVSDASRRHLAARYGHAADEPLAFAAADPALARTIVDGHPDLLAEVVVAVRREQAIEIADVLLRRTRLGLIAAPRLRVGASGPVTGEADGDPPVDRVADVMATELGWDGPRRLREIERWREVALAEGVG